MWGWIQSLFNVLFRKFKQFLNEVGKILFNQGAALILNIARQAVLELAHTDLSNEEKRKEAFLRISSYAIEKGIKVKDSVIYSIIELVLQEIKSIERGENG